MAIDKEILADFREESRALIHELEELVNSLEDSEGILFPVEELKEFSQKIDRIMGAAKTLLSLAPENVGLSFLANTAEICKTMGYQAVALQRMNLVPIFAGFWAETVELLSEVLEHLDSESETKELVTKKSAQLERRLSWLAEKVAPGSEEEKQKVLSMLKKL